MRTPGIGLKIVHKVAAADDEDAFVPEGRKPLSDLKKKGRGPGLVNASLYNGNFRRRINVPEHRPCSVVESPRLVWCHRQRRQPWLDPARQYWMPRSG